MTEKLEGRQYYIATGTFAEDVKTITEGKGYITNHLIVAEECAELTKATSKMIRYIDDRVAGKIGEGVYIELADNILEEAADVIICIRMLMQMYGFEFADLDEEVWKKMQLNLKRTRR